VKVLDTFTNTNFAVRNLQQSVGQLHLPAPTIFNPRHHWPDNITT